MQVAVATPSATLVGEQVCFNLSQDYLPPCDKQASATIMAKLFVDTYVPTMFQAEVSTEVEIVRPAVGIVREEAQECIAQREEDKAHAVPQTNRRGCGGPCDCQVCRQSPRKAQVEPTAAVVPTQSNTDSAPFAFVEVDAQSHCCLENCDRILPNLYIGGREAAVDHPGLAEQGIRAVVCCNRELEFATSKFLPDLEYYRVDVEDMGREPIELFFPEATEFIHTQLLQERPVLVHCKAGVSRSASVLLAYLLEYCGYTLHDAFILTLRLRPTITPNPGFMERLRDYEKEKCGINVASLDLHKYVAWFQAAERCLEPDLKPD